MAFTFGAGDLARGGVNTQLLILPSVGLVMVWTIRPIANNEMSEGLEIQFSFPCGTEVAVSVRLIQDSNCTASAAYTLVTCDLSDVDEDRMGGGVIRGDVVWRRLGREGV